VRDGSFGYGPFFVFDAGAAFRRGDARRLLRRLLHTPLRRAVAGIRPLLDDGRERRRPRARRRGVPRGERPQGNAQRDEGGGEGEEHDAVQDGARRPARTRAAIRARRPDSRRRAETKPPRLPPADDPTTTRPAPAPRSQAKNLDADLTEMANVFMEARCASLGARARDARPRAGGDPPPGPTAATPRHTAAAAESPTTIGSDRSDARPRTPSARALISPPPPSLRSSRARSQGHEAQDRG
jgi:hypothetical protein